VTYFADTRIEYTPRETLAKKLVYQAMEKYPRLIELKIYGATDKPGGLRVIASSNEDELGQPAGKYEQEVVARDAMFYGKQEGRAIVSLPLHDHNGDAVAAVRVVLRGNLGQTEQNAVARAKPIVKEMESRVRRAKDLTQ
jgi:hypothetical protein